MMCWVYIMKLQRFNVRYGRTVVYFGPESFKNLENVINRYKRVYVVTSRSAAKVSGALGDILSILSSYNIEYEIFDKIEPNPMQYIIEQLADELIEFSAEAVIGIGGGSVIDSAKIASVLSICGGNIKDYVYGVRQIHGARPIIAVNLTHGTGSEINRYAVVTIDAPRTKFGIASEYLYPLASIDDPRYTLSLPQKQIVYTALDAFYHAYEAATGKDTSPFVLTLAEEITKHVVNWLPIAIKDPNNIEARYWLLYSSMLAGIAIDNSRAHIIHAIENVLSGINVNLPHGAGLAILGPQATIYIHRAVPEYSYRVLRYIDSGIRPSRDDAEKVGKAITEFQQMLGLKEKLSDYGFKEEDADTVVDAVFKALGYSLRLVPFNVREDDIRDIYLKSI
uniref:Iron-containing alcohol dehydrogenase n=1 Tax=Ignisphaera aggregans TaxID=334771 RepID=A0A7J3MWF4_9CREN